MAMSFVIAAPGDDRCCGAIGHDELALSAANARYGPTTAYWPRCRRSVSGHRALFTSHGQDYQALSTKMAVLHDQFGRH
ncbi:PE family protein [Mycobacterium kansasii]|uniref:PE family protein n=1 Tax=Mycobacterium kansasii TaxID=1768 RepID=A0A1V3WBH7_MYCKA|nr:PE family protein [Mycobacterium kansasii]